jgi:succinate dehydrogenase / fumarate reductase cytochrome b subunit
LIPVSDPATTPGEAGKYHFLLRRLHSLSGIIPVGVYLCIHLSVNATAVVGPESYQQQVNRIHSLGAFLLPAELFGIFLPILFHAILGVIIFLEGKSNPMSYSYAANWRYALQRWTGLIAFAFIIYHVWQTNPYFAVLGGGRFEPHAAYVSTAEILQSAPWIAPIYAIGIAAAVFHLANGIWTALITWGITVGDNAQRKAGWVCAAVGVVLLVFGIGSLTSLRTADLEEALSPAIHADAGHLPGAPDAP